MSTSSSCAANSDGVTAGGDSTVTIAGFRPRTGAYTTGKSSRCGFGSKTGSISGAGTTGVTKDPGENIGTASAALLNAVEKILDDGSERFVESVSEVLDDTIDISATEVVGRGADVGA